MTNEKTQAILTNDNRRKLYQDWLALPMTQEMRGVVRELAFPAPLRDMSQAAYQYGILEGFRRLEAVLFDLTSIFDPKTAAEASLLDADYGAVEVMKKEKEN